MNELQAATSKAIVNIFETGSLLGNYGSVVVDPKDPGHLTYGRSQTTLASGNLYVLIASYCGAPGARYATSLLPYLDRLQVRDLTLDGDMDLRAVLKNAGADPTMHQVQDRFFDSTYWSPANRLASGIRLGAANGLATALGIATVYDSIVHGSFAAIRSSTDSSFESLPQEHEWVNRYIAIRHGWLAANKVLRLRDTVYRMDELKKLTDAANWDLALNMTVRGIVVSPAALRSGAADVPGTPPIRGSAHDPAEVVLSLRTPYMTGAPVELVQNALSKAGYLDSADVDGIYGPFTVELVKQMQVAHDLTADGIVGPATWVVVEELGNA